MFDNYGFTVKDRFLRYVTIDTQSNPASKTNPSTDKQKSLGRLLVQELLSIGIADAHLDEYGYVYATIPANTTKQVVDIILMGLFCWILSKFAVPRFGTILAASIFTGLIAFLNTVYTGHIWYETFDLMAHLTDAIVGWGIAGLWLGWWMSKK